MSKKVFEFDFRGRKLVVENGEMAKQANGAVLVRYGDTVVLSTVVVKKEANLLSDFFPLMVIYQEKLYSVGKIPGGFKSLIQYYQLILIIRQNLLQCLVQVYVQA